MTQDTASQPADRAEAATKLTIEERLRKRLERERKARIAAESIADRRMRELWLANRELDQRVAERTLKLEETLEALERNTTAAAAFLSNLSHEMRTPLNGVKGMLELLATHSHSETETTYLDAAMESSDRLSKLIDRLLDLVELRSGRVLSRPQATTIDLIKAELERVWRLPSLQAQKILTVHAAGDQAFAVDVERLQQILGELLDNVMVHADPGVVNLGLQSDGNELVCVLTDNGPGFDPTTQSDNLLDTFASLDTSPGRKTEGSGIGLALAQELVRALEGTLEIASAPGTATKVTVRVPISAGKTSQNTA